MKEGVFSALQFDVEGRRVLDLFAGTGQMGIECLSRGAASAVFVDRRKDAFALIKKNLALTGLEDRARVAQGEALTFLRSCGERFDVIFLDPPYKTELLEQCIEKIAGFDILREYGIIVCESGLEWNIPALTPPYEPGREYRYGQIKLTLCRRAGSVRQ